MGRAWDRRTEQRRKKLKAVDDQVADGTLVVRAMTDDERDAWETRRTEAAARMTPKQVKDRDEAVDRRRQRTENAQKLSPGRVPPP